jgi:hypothetical protein
MQQLTIFEFLSDDDLAPIWDEFLPYAQKYWRLQRESWSAGNCKDWWKSRFYDYYIGHGYGDEAKKRRLYYFERGTFNKFPDFWRRYGHKLQSAAGSFIQRIGG